MNQRDFNALERNSDGDIVNLSEVWFSFTDKQRNEMLTSDDWQRCNDLNEEIMCELMMMEFG